MAVNNNDVANILRGGRQMLCGFGRELKLADQVSMDTITFTSRPSTVDEFTWQSTKSFTLFTKVNTQQASGDELTSMPDGMAFFLTEKIPGKSDPGRLRYVYVIRPFLKEGSDSSTMVAGALCSDSAYSQTHDPVNLNIEKKIYECVVGPKGLKVGSLVHSFNRVVRLEEVRRYLLSGDDPYWFLLVEPGE
jgi:hypothetical protein